MQLGDDFVEQAKGFFCGNLFVEAGIGAGGLAAIQAANPYALVGATLVSVAYSQFCKEEFSPQDHLPQAPMFEGGQCEGVQYRIVVNTVDWNSSTTESAVLFVYGPIVSVTQSRSSPGSAWYCYVNARNFGGNPQSYVAGSADANNLSYGFTSIQVAELTRTDGRADNCGSLPSSPVSIIGPPTLQPEDTEIDVTVPDGEGGDLDFSLPMTFLNFKVDKLIGDPKIEFDLGGINIGSLKVDIDWGTDPPTVSEPDLDEIARAIRDVETELNEEMSDLAELLAAIQNCVCKPEVELESLYLPYATCSSDGPTSEVRRFLVAKDTTSEEDVRLFEESELLARDGCVLVPDPADPSVIASGSSSFFNRVFYTSELDLDVVSVVLLLVDGAEHTRNLYVLAGDDSEGKFGHIDWSPSGYNAASGGVFCWTKTTYFDLPYPRRPGRVRISLKPGFSWELWDTGERLGKT